MKDKKKTSLYVAIAWAFTTAVWIITVCINFGDAGFSPFLLALQCATAVISGAAAVANFSKYKRSRGNDGE